eukprot:97283_1
MDARTLALTVSLLLICAMMYYQYNSHPNAMANQEQSLVRKTNGIIQFNPEFVAFLSATMQQIVHHYNPVQTQTQPAAAVATLRVRDVPSADILSTRMVLPHSVIIGPLIDSGQIYYDVHPRQSYWFNYGNDILKHWETHTPQGVNKETKLAINGRLSNPYSDTIPTGYWSDSIRRDVGKCVDNSRWIGGVSYITIYKYEATDVTQYKHPLRVYRLLQAGNAVMPI